MISMESKDLIKDSILESATKLINQFGYGALTLSELARHTNMTKQRLYYHFKTPEEIICQLAADWGRSGQEHTIKALAETNEVGPYKVLAMGTGVFMLMRQNFELARLGLVILQSSPHIPKLNEVTNQVVKTGRDRIKSFLIQNSKFKKMPDQKLEAVITTLHSNLYGFYFYTTIANDYKNLEVYEKNCKDALRKIIDSYL